MPRRRLTLLERVVNDSFEAGRHGDLLAEDDLPEQPPDQFGGRERAWRALRDRQAWYRASDDSDGGYQLAIEFSGAVTWLHGGKEPLWH
jgi:hypothetical protein